MELQTEFDRRIRSRNFCQSTTYRVFVAQSIWQKYPVLRECCSLCCMKCCVLQEMYKRYCAHWFVRFGKCMQLLALVFSMLQMMQRARIACEFATESARGVFRSLLLAILLMMLGATSYTAFKKHILLRCRTMPTVWAVGRYAAFDGNKRHGACCVTHVLYTKQNSLRFFLNLVTLVAIAVMVQCLAQEYGSLKLLQKCLASRISPFSSTPARKLAEDSSVKVPSHYRSGWKEMYR